MNNKEYLNVVEEEWDWLIVLDACRYDYFKKYYGEFLSGYLEKRWSLASNTPNWLIENFTDYYDNIEYISANSFINDEDVPLDILTDNEGVERFDDWRPKLKFRKVYDLSAGHWFDEESSVVLPETVVDFVRKNEFEPYTRKIIHFIQPHRPFLGHEDFEKLRWGIDEIQSKFADIAGKTDELYTRLIQVVFNKFTLGWWFYKYKQHYIENLKRVLKNVSVMVEYLDGRIIVSADHGELFGEYEKIGHPDMNVPELREVPWLEVKK